MRFAHLHLHTCYSMLDSTVRIKELFSYCDEIGVEAVAITDHGNMYGVIEFIKAAAKMSEPESDAYKFLGSGKPFKVKPIVGCEMYITDDMTLKNSENKSYNHLILLAKNMEGYQNLIKLNSLAFIDGMYYKPRIDFELLSKYSKGLVCLSACLSGQIPRALLNGKYAEADEWAKKYKALFNDDFYIELMDHRLMSQRRILPLLKDIALKNGIKMVATNDVHYLKKTDALTQKVLKNVSYGNTMSPDEGFREGLVEEDSDDFYPTDEFYLKSGDEMSELFSAYEGAIENTIEIANKCDCRFFHRDKLLPNYRPENGMSAEEFLKKLTFDGLQRKYKLDDNPQKAEILKRANDELTVIIKQGYVEYFLIVWDFIHYSESNGVSVGPGRGSGVGSIVAYAIGITKVDPLRYSLIFERFLNPERVSNPDFDIDFCVEGREKVIDYVIFRYGERNVSQIITFSTLAAKAAVKDVGRVFDRPYAEVDKLTKLMPKIMGRSQLKHILGFASGEDTVFIPQLKEIYESDLTSQRILDMAMRIENLPRQTGMHAAGVIICQDEIYNHIPMAKTGDGIITTQFNMNECEEIGLLKMDFLGLTTLTDISKTLLYIKEGQGIDINLYEMEYNDKNVFDLIGEGDTHAVFQLESEGMKRFLKDFKPSSMEDIIAAVALYRPGPMDKIDEYVRNKRHPELVKFAHPLLKPILTVTYGIMVYQEQVMDAVRVLAGYSLGRADIMRRIMSKKKHEEMEKERTVFLFGTPDGSVKGCINNGVDEAAGNKIYDDMTSFASYAFNKSHAAAYAYLAYQTAFLKRYYTPEFITAVLNNRITKNDEITKYLMYLKERNITVLPPNINKSKSDFSVENGSVRIGLKGLKHVGESVVSVVVAERKNGDFKSFEDFVARMQTALYKNNKGALNKKTLENLIYAGAFDCFNVYRSQLMASYETIMDRSKKELAVNLSGQMSFFEVLKTDDKFTYPSLKEYPLNEKLKREKEVAGVYLTAHPLDEYAQKLKEYPFNTSMLSALNEDEEGSVGVGGGSSGGNVGGGGVGAGGLKQQQQQIVLAGMLISASTRIAKSGKEFGLGVIEDLFGSAELLIMGDKLIKYRNVFKPDTLVVIHGRISGREDETTIFVERIEPLSAEGAVQKKRMCVYFDSFNDYQNSMHDLQDILDDYKGDDELYISYFDEGKKTVRRLGDITVLATDMLKYELLGCDGVLDVKID